MNGITTLQNTEKQLNRLAAQRNIYAVAKKILAAQIWLSGPIAVVLTFIGLALPELKGYVALWSVLVVVADVVWLTPWQKRMRDTAAKVQELFDCDVLILPWNDLKSGTRPDPELVKQHSDLYGISASKHPPLENWYSSEIEGLPIQVARLVCQRANCWWDSAQRRRYAMAIIIGTGVVLISVLWIGLAMHLTFEELIARALLPTLPVLILGYRQFAEQIEAAMRSDRLKEHAQRLWDGVLSGMDPQHAIAVSRNLQDEILESRRRSPLVFDFVFSRLRPSLEKQMNHGVAELAQEAKRRL